MRPVNKSSKRFEKPAKVAQARQISMRSAVVEPPPPVSTTEPTELSQSSKAAIITGSVCAVMAIGVTIATVGYKSYNKDDESSRSVMSEQDLEDVRSGRKTKDGKPVII